MLARASVGDGLHELTRHVLGDDIERKVFASILALSRHSSPNTGIALQALGSLVPVADAEWLLGQFAAHQDITSTTDEGHGPSDVGNQPSVADGTDQTAVVDEMFA